VGGSVITLHISRIRTVKHWTMTFRNCVYMTQYKVASEAC